MKKILALLLALSLLLCGCGKEDPVETTLAPQESTPAATDESISSGEGEGILDPETQLIYCLVKMIVTNDEGQELWGREYSYDDTGFCTREREYSNIGSASYSRVNSPDMLGRIGSSLFTELDGSQYTVFYTYDEFDRCLREDLTRELLFLTYTTTPIALTDALESLLRPLAKIKVPVHAFAMMMTIALRFIPTLIEEADKIMKAQMARGADFESGNLIARAKAMIPLLVPLFVSAFRRAGDLAMAMEARCYRGGHNRTKMRQSIITKSDYIASCILVIYLVIIMENMLINLLQHSFLNQN